jgi:S1-C subfamily serine protease
VLVVPALGGEDGDDPLQLATGQTAGGFQDTVAKVTPSVVQIESGDSLGSGIVLDDEGHVVTNAHVVAGSRRFVVTAADGARYSATLRASFPQGDLAVIDVRGVDLTPAPFADSSRVEVGELALAIGNPLGLRSSVTQGIVSSTSRTVGEGNGVALPSVIQTSAPINPGNSGGALVDETGAVIGMPTLSAGTEGAPAPGIGFAISSNTVKSIASQAGRPGGRGRDPAWRCDPEDRRSPGAERGPGGAHARGGEAGRPGPRRARRAGWQRHRAGHARRVPARVRMNVEAGAQPATVSGAVRAGSAGSWSASSRMPLSYCQAGIR